MRDTNTIYAALIAGVFVLVGLAVQSTLAWRVLAQKDGNDRREGHWKRIQWAVDLSLADGPQEQRLSSVVLGSLAAEPRLDPYDYLVVEKALEVQRAAAEQRIAEEIALQAALAEDDAPTRGAPDGEAVPPGRGQEQEHG